MADGKLSDTQKTSLEVMRVTTPFLLSNQSSIRNNLFPFIALSVFGFVSVYDTSIMKLTSLVGETGGGGVSNIFGIPLTPLAISIGLFTIFVRFGFLLYHGLDLVCSHKLLIAESEFSGSERAVLMNSLKDAYLIDTFLIFMHKPFDFDADKIFVKRLSSFFVNLMLVVSLLFAQSIVLATFCNFSIHICVLISAIYIFLYTVFFVKIRNIDNSYVLLSEENLTPRRLVKAVYVFLPILSGLLSYLVIFRIISAGSPAEFVRLTIF